MKNVTVYIGTIKKCLYPKQYQKDGEITFIPEFESITMQMGYDRKNTEEIDKQAILIKDGYNHYYQYKLTNSFIDNMKIRIKNVNSALLGKPLFKDDLFVDEKTLIPYYDEQPKSLSLRKLKRDIIMDPRIKSGIEKNK